MDGTAPPPSLPRYTVEDHRRDARPPLDIWAEYLRMRYARREGFYGRLEPSAQELIRKEVRRIRYFRDHFKDYRISSSDELALVDLLDSSRSKWREIALQRATAELAKYQRDIERNGETARSVRSQNIIRMVEKWGTKDYAALQDARDPGRYMADMEAGPEPGDGEDDPRQPDYGYNGWIIVWDEERGGVNMSHPLVHGSFPHQKISIQQLLYNKTGTPLRRSTTKGQFRYFHLPANSMKWVEDAMSRYYDEDNIEFDSKRVLNIKSNAQRLLRNELWRGQQRGGNNLPAHSRQIGSRCSVIPSAPTSSTNGNPQPGPRKDFALFMPFLHWEVEKRLHRMTQFVQVAKSRKEHRDRLRRASTSRYKGKFVDLAKIHAAKPPRPVTGFETGSKRSWTWRPQRPLAKYIWHVAKLFQIIDEAADGRLVDDHLFNEPPLHMRRTLEQFYYWTADDTTHRDRDQVACRATRAMTDDPEAAARIVMVDQLWLWILDDNTVISSFPRRWGRNKPDPSAVHRGIRDRLGDLDGDEIHSVYDLAFIVIDECSKVFFDRTKPLDQRPEVVDLFSSAISNIADKKTIAYEGFGDAVSRISLDTLDTVEQLLRRSLNIGFEWSILVEAQQVIDELQIMQEIFAQQTAVMKDFERSLKSMHPSSKSKQGGAGQEQAKLAKMKHEKALERVASLVSDMEQRRDELASMERLQTKTRGQLRELLDMKQQQSNIIEAKAAIQRADESVLQGRSIVVFTVVTIFFLPLSFLASVFGMNAKEISNDGIMPLARQLTYMFAISAAVIFISLALAFSEWTRTVLSVTYNMVYATVEDWLGWRNKKSSYNSTALKKKQVAKFQQLESRATARRLTEISSRARDASPKEDIEMKNSSSWGLGKLANGGLGRFRNSKGPARGGPVENV